MLYTYSFSNHKRDLSDILTTVIREEPRFISNFHSSSDAMNSKHEYLEDNLSAKGFVAEVVDEGYLRVPETVANMLKPGMLIRPANDPALFEIQSINCKEVVLELVCRNGSAMSTASDLKREDKTFHFVSPQTVDDESGEFVHNIQWNATQIFRKEIVLSGSALSLNLYVGV